MLIFLHLCTLQTKIDFKWSGEKKKPSYCEIVIGQRQPCASSSRPLLVVMTGQQRAVVSSGLRRALFSLNMWSRRRPVPRAQTHAHAHPYGTRKHVCIQCFDIVYQHFIITLSATNVRTVCAYNTAAYNSIMPVFVGPPPPHVQPRSPRLYPEQARPAVPAAEQRHSYLLAVAPSSHTRSAQAVTSFTLFTIMLFSISVVFICLINGNNANKI